MQDYQRLREIVRKLVQKLGLLRKNDAACCQVTPQQCHALTEIGRAEGLMITELAEVLNLDKSTVSRTVDALIAGGLAGRCENPDSRRAVRISLTTGGRGAVARIDAGLDEYFQRILQKVPESKRALVAEALELLFIAVEEQKNCCSE